MPENIKKIIKIFKNPYSYRHRMKLAAHETLKKETQPSVGSPIRGSILQKTKHHVENSNLRFLGGA